MTKKLTRRTLLESAALGAVAFAVQGASAAQEKEFVKREGFKGNIKQSVSKWCFGKIPLAEFCEQCKKIGMVGVDLILPDDWATVKDHGMVVTMGSLPGQGIPKNINHVENHEFIIGLFEKYIPMAAELNVPNIISLCGNREGMDDQTGMKNCALALKKIMPLAEKYKINVVMELLNSKDHKDYMCDHTEWGVDLCKMVGSDRFKLLYDIYHMQRMEGEIINTIKKYHEYIGHYHTGGNPGRKDLDDQQEIYYPPIMKAILETGYQGYVAHEFLPKNGFQSLYNAVTVCDV